VLLNGVALQVYVCVCVFFFMYLYMHVRMCVCKVGTSVSTAIWAYLKFIIKCANILSINKKNQDCGNRSRTLS
jgi:hypothetical protein